MCTVCVGDHTKTVTKHVPSLHKRQAGHMQAADRVSPPWRFLTPVRNDALTWQVRVPDPVQDRAEQAKAKTCSVGVSFFVDKSLLLAI